jgi:mannitol/fructose-specific phosphotransferase system IIA component
MMVMSASVLEMEAEMEMEIEKSRMEVTQVKQGLNWQKTEVVIGRMSKK